jgi:hypothetical protein
MEKENASFSLYVRCKHTQEMVCSFVGLPFSNFVHKITKYISITFIPSV